MATPNDNAPLGLPALAGQQRSNQDQSVPPYMRVAMEQEYTKMTVREEEQVRDASAVPLQSVGNPYIELGEPQVKVPNDPPLSDRELLAIHAEVLALQRQFGVTYKAACSRIYFQKMEKLKMAEQAAKGWDYLSEQLRSATDRLSKLVNSGN